VHGWGVLLGYGVVSPGKKRVATQQALDGQPASFERAIAADRIHGILAAGRDETAV